MERYYKKSARDTSRTKRNTRLYNSIYSYGKYSNIEGIAEIDGTNEIDITKVKRMLETREKYQAERRYRKLTEENKQDVSLPRTLKKYNEDEDRTYDIMDVLSKAKKNKEPDDKERVLSKTSYELLNNLDLKKNYRNSYFSSDEDDMVQTISSAHTLNQLNDADLAADMFSDLRGNNENTQVGNLNDFKPFINEHKNDDKTATMDSTFFTSSLKFKKKDFLGSDEEKKGSLFKTIFVTILVLGIIGAVLYFVGQKLGFF